MNILLLSRVLALVRTAIFALLFMGSVGIFLPRYLGLLQQKAALTPALLGAIPLLAGAYIALRCAFDFAWRGRGTPAPFDPPIQLVVSGMYRFVRNPMYAGMALFMIGEWLIWGSNLKGALIYLAAYVACITLFVVGYEEPALRKKFGEEYEEFRRNVPRFLPRLAPWNPEQTKSAAHSEL